MKIILNITKYILIFILIISIILTIAINVFASTILNKEYVLGKLEESNYYEYVYNQVEDNFEKYIQQSGLNEEVIKDIVTRDEIKNSIVQIVNNIYEGQLEELDTNIVKERLEKNINDSLQGQNITNSTKEAIEEFENRIIKEYSNTIIHTQYEKDINAVIKKVKKYIPTAQKALIISDIILVVLVLLLNIKKIFRGIGQIGIALLTSGAVYLIATIILNSRIKINNIYFWDEGFSNSLKNIINSIVSMVNNYSIILLIIGMILIIISNFVLFKNTKTEETNNGGQ